MCSVVKPVEVYIYFDIRIQHAAQVQWRRDGPHNTKNRKSTWGWTRHPRRRDRTDLRQYFVFTCVCKRGKDATYFTQKHKIGEQKLEMKYTESDRVLQEWTSKRCKSAMPWAPKQTTCFIDDFNKLAWWRWWHHVPNRPWALTKLRGI
jgi:hypothetical protein